MKLKLKTPVDETPLFTNHTEDKSLIVDIQYIHTIACTNSKLFQMAYRLLHHQYFTKLRLMLKKA